MKCNQILVLFTKVDFDSHIPEEGWNPIVLDCCPGKTPFFIWKCDYQYLFLSQCFKWFVDEKTENQNIAAPP